MQITLSITESVISFCYNEDQMMSITQVNEGNKMIQ